MLPGETFAAIAELVKVGISVIELVDPEDPETWIIRFNNEAASEASQNDVRRYRGKRFLESFPGVRGSPFITWYRQVHASGQEREIPEQRYGDEVVPDAAFRVWLTPLPGACVLGQYVNVTLQRRAEGRLKRLNAELEAQVAERTQKLQASLQMIREVAYAAAHDLQTPVVQILGITELVRSGVVSPDDEIERIAQAATHAKQQLDALLSYAAIPVSSEAIGRVDVAAAVEEALRELSALADGAEVTVDAQPVELHAEPRRFGLLLRHVLDNALRYHLRERQRRVHVSVSRDGGMCRIEVRDNGIGVPEQHHEAIFEAFKRLHADAVYPGSGVGLAFCRSYVQHLGGAIAIASDSGAGATVTIRVPVEAEATTPAPDA